MTQREQLIRAVLDLPDSEVEPVMDFVVSRGHRQPNERHDEWGDLKAQTRALAEQASARLDVHERNAGSPPW